MHSRDAVPGGCGYRPSGSGDKPRLDWCVYMCQNGRFLGDFSGRLYGALGRSIYFYPQVPLRDQVR